MAEVIEQHWHKGPHIQFSDSITFITWRLAFTLPKHIRELFANLSSEKSQPEQQHYLKDLQQNNVYLYQQFWKYDEALGNYSIPNLSLNDTAIAEILKTAFHYYDSSNYDLHAYCIMSNHIHMVISSKQIENIGYKPISEIVRSLKRYTANQINKAQGKQGQIWDNYYFDRIIRDYNNYRNVIEYILNNPVKAGLVDDSRKWKDSYFNDSLVQG